MLVTILHTQNFIKIHQFVLKILNGNKILTSIKGNISIENFVVLRLNVPVNNFSVMSGRKSIEK